jgi:Arc/MetJ-type ribon-helix-helix transcriptional regulator
LPDELFLLLVALSWYLDGMKLSISVPDETVALLDRVVELQGLPSRSAAIQQGIELLVSDALVGSYRAAFDEFEQSGDAELWENASGDGIESEAAWW